MNDFKMIYAGKAQPTARRFNVFNPATGEVVATAPDATLEDLNRAVAAAKLAFEVWSQKSDAELKAACEQVVAKMAAHAEELATLTTLEQGKPLNGLGSRWEMGGAQAWGGYTAGLSLPMKVLQDDASGRIEQHRRPVGVVGSITPWNFPVMIAIWHVMPALRTGNTVVIKPSPYTPLATLRLVELMNEVLPPGVLNVVTGQDNNEVNLGGAMAAHPDIRKIVFTGSCATGQKVMQSAATTMKRLTLELGGNDAGIVLPDVDPAAIAEQLFWGAFLNNGQTCAAMKRLYVHDKVHDDVCEALVEFAKRIPVGNGMEEGSILGPIQNRVQFNKVAQLVEQSAARGKVLLGGKPGEGLFFPPTIIAGLKNGDPLVDEEQFGPALPIIRYTNLEEAITAANESPNGLGGSIWTSDIDAGRKLARRIDSGSVWLNKHGAIQPNAPFGGVKQSGFGVEFTEEGLAEYTDIQVVFS